MSAHRTGVLWVSASAVSYSLFAVFSKWALEDLGPTSVLFWRFAIAVPVAWVVVLVRARSGGPHPFSAPVVPLLIAGGVFGGVALFAFGALDHLSASLYTVVIYTYPAMVAVGSIFLGNRPPRRLWIAVGVTMVGIGLTVPQVFDNPDADALGLFLTLGNAVTYAAYVLATGRLMDPARPRPSRRPRAVTGGSIDGLVASTWSFTGSLGFALVAVAFGGLELPSDAGATSGLLGLGVISTVIAGATLFVGLTRLAAATAAVVATLEPALTLIWAVAILGESLVAIQIAGAALVLVGVLWAQRTSPVTAVEPG